MDYTGYFDDLIGSLPLVLETFEAPEAHLLEGTWYAGGASTSWRVRTRHPLTRVFHLEAATGWCSRSVLAESRQPTSLWIPFALGSSPGYPDTAIPPALQGIIGPPQLTHPSGWSPQPIEQVRAWLSATEEYLSRQREILADLHEWSEATAQLDYRKPSHADRIANAVPPQRRAMERLLEAGDAYEPVYEQIKAAVRDAPTSLVDPSELLLRWADRRAWLVVNDGHRIHLYRADTMPDRPWPKYWDPSLVDYGEHTHRLAHLAELSRRHVTHEAGGGTLEVVWDQASVEHCDREIAELWKPLDAEHDLPDDFASLWRALFGYDFRSASGWNGGGTRTAGNERPPAASSGWSGSGGVGGSGGGDGGV